MSIGGHSHFHDGEVIADFATVGVLAAIDLAVRQDINNGNAITLLDRSAASPVVVASATC